jgi:hypothetical protein
MEGEPMKHWSQNRWSSNQPGGGHLSLAELTETLQGEGGWRELGRRREHLAECRECAGELEALRADLEAAAALVDGGVRERDAAWAEQQWQRVRPVLEPYPERRRGWQGWALWPRLGWAAGAAMLLAGSFAAGRLWEQRQHPAAVAVNQPALVAATPVAGEQKAAPQAAPRPVVVVVLADHLDRSERFLVQLKHAELTTEETAPELRDEARSLLKENRVARERTEAKEDPALRGALDRLNALLDQLANAPDGLSQADLIRLRDQMNAAGLLFEVRVLRTRIPGSQTMRTPRHTGGEA